MAQEEERQRVARDIHDGPAQSLSNLALKTELCEKLVNMDPDRHVANWDLKLVEAPCKTFER